MICTRQRVIEIILNEQTAIKAAEYISSCNNKAFWWQVGSQALQGVFTGMAAGATGPVRLIEMGINVGIYYISEYDKELGTQATRANIAYDVTDDVVSSMTSVNATRSCTIFQRNNEWLSEYDENSQNATNIRKFLQPYT